MIIQSHSLNGKPQQSPLISAPVAIIALGEFGRQVLVALEQARQARPVLPRLPALLAAPSGWQTQWDEPVTGPWEEPESWWQAHRREGRQALRSLINLARSYDTSPHPDLSSRGLDIYLIGHLNEPATRTLWPLVLEAARQAHIPFADHVFTLIFATDSLTFRSFEAEEAAAFLQGLDQLGSELLRAADGSEPPGRVGWAYLVDSLDIYARPLRPLCWKTDATVTSLEQGAIPSPAERLALQAHLIAEFIALATAGLRRTPQYESTSLSQLGHELRSGEPQPWIATFAAGSQALPVPALVARAQDQFAHVLIDGYLLGEEAPGDLPAARKMRSRWLAEHTLNPDGLRQRIEQERGGQPLLFPIEPPAVEQIPDEWLVDTLLSWDTLLWNRWQRPSAPAARMAQNGERLAESAAQWLDAELDSLLQQRPGGVQIADLFVEEAEKALEAEQDKTERGDQRKGGWVQRLLSSLRLPPRDPTVLPDLDRPRRRLERALARRVIRRAVWTRAVFFAATLLAFAWAAYLAAGQQLGLYGFVARLLGRQPAWGVNATRTLDLLALALAALLLALVHGWLDILLTDRAIHSATGRFLAVVRRKYQALQERALRQERAKVYAALTAQLQQWRQAIGVRRELLQETAQVLQEALQAGPEVAPLLTEEILLAPESWDTLLPDGGPFAKSPYDEDLHTVAESFLHQPDRPSWRAETAPELLAGLRAFAAERLTVWRAGLTLPAWLGGPQELGEMARSLSSRLHPAWPLSREERAAVEMPAAYAPLLPAHFVGLPEGAVGWEPDSRHYHLFRTGEPGRLAFVPTIHALPLRHLRLWQEVEAISQTTVPEPDAPERSVEPDASGTQPPDLPVLARQPESGAQRRAIENHDDTYI